jgi:hypothetical protein
MESSGSLEKGWLEYSYSKTNERAVYSEEAVEN